MVLGCTRALLSLTLSLSLSFSVPVNPDEHALSCQINGLLFRDGASAEVLKESADKSSIYCQQCQCQSGKHTCHKIYDCDIQKVACEKSVKIPGQCCPSCGEYSGRVGGQLINNNQLQNGKVAFANEPVFFARLRERILKSKWGCLTNVQNLLLWANPAFWLTIILTTYELIDSNY